MTAFENRLSEDSGLLRITVPDVWQQEAVIALREGKDVVVHAPTGSGKTLIFELWSNQGKTRSKAVYTVPTRALANDKLAEWRAKGWNVGIATGDLSDNLEAPIVVATLETQKNRLIQGDGPDLLVIDEYQMLGDEDRGLNYEFAIAMAPQDTQLLLLSGSVGNPHHVVQWLLRLGRSAKLVRHDERPVPLEEVYAHQLNVSTPSGIKGYWPRFIAKSLAEDLGPILVFAPQRKSAESLAQDLARQLPNPNPLTLNEAQTQYTGPHLAKLLQSRVAFHHSGLSYAVRAGVIEPLAKAGQLRVVVATMGLAAGINFSLRSVALAGDTYRRGFKEHFLQADEILQMFGRAGRRGIDETGYALISANQIGLREGYPTQLSRNGMVDWSALLWIMSNAATAGHNPFEEAVRAQERLFTTKPIVLGVEFSLRHRDVPCGLSTDSERASHIRKRQRQFLNSQREWEPVGKPQEVSLERIRCWSKEEVQSKPNPEGQAETRPSLEERYELRPILECPSFLANIGPGNLVKLPQPVTEQRYGKLLTVAERTEDGQVLLTKWTRKVVNWKKKRVSHDRWLKKVVPFLEKRMRIKELPVLHFREQSNKIHVLLSLAEQKLGALVDRHGQALWKPPTREVLPEDCARCTVQDTCLKTPSSTGVALLWKRLKLVDDQGVPTRRGRIVSHFTQGDGLAIAATLEDPTYSLEELIYDLANLDAGFRFSGDEHRWDGRLAHVCRETYGLVNLQGYLESGVPCDYGYGAEKIVASVHRHPLTKSRWITPWIGIGDIDRMIIEWRSLLRRIAHAPEMEWSRWSRLQQLAREILDETESPTLRELPPLDYHQTQRINHRLKLRKGG